MFYRLVLYACAWGYMTTATFAAEYTVTDLGTLGGTSAYANAINERGEIVGASQTATNAEWRAFTWNSCHGIKDLGTLSGGHYYATSVNDVGQIAIQYLTRDFRTSGAFLYQNGTIRDIGSLGGVNASATDINNFGQVVGQSDNADGEERAFLFAVNSMQDLGTLGGASSSAQAINDLGHAVGYAINAEGQYRAFVYRDGTMTDLGVSADRSFAYDINDGGAIVGSSRRGTTTSGFRYLDGVITDLGSLGGTETNPRAINDRGQVVGSSATRITGQHAFIYDGGVMQDLNSLISSVSGWELGEAFDINDAGEIVGVGQLNGLTRAFLLTPVRDVIEGDTNADGRVNLDDLNNVRNHFGHTGLRIPGDTNQDCAVDLTDLNDVRNNFGAPTALQVPEPSGLMIVLVACLTLAWRCTRLSGLSALPAIASGCLAATASAAEYSVTVLGTLGGGSSRATAINDLGQVVGAFDTLSPSRPHAFIWDHCQGMRDLGTAGRAYSSATAVNNLGHVVGTFGQAGLFAGFQYRDGMMSDIGSLGGVNVEAYGINDSGRIVGRSQTDVGSNFHAFVSFDGVMTDLGTLGGATTIASAINNSNQAVGWSQTVDGTDRAVLFDENAIVELSLPGHGSFAYDINDAGAIVGSYFVDQNETATQGFVLSAATSIDVGSLGGSYSEARAINDAGQIVGNSTTRGNVAQHGFIYDRGSTRDLNSLIPSDSGWLLTDALDINNAGEIVGSGVFNGQMRAFLLTPNREYVIGDTNADGQVDLEDLNNVRNNFGDLGLRIPGDTNQDCAIDLIDLNAVRNNFGTGAASPVPEPASIMLLAAVASGQLLLWPKRRSAMA